MLTIAALTLSLAQPLMILALPTIAGAATVPIFENGFESDDFSAWTSADVANWSVNSTNAHSGSKKANVVGDTVGDKILLKDQSTEGYENIDLEYWYKAATESLEADDKLFVEYSTNGTDWIELFVIEEGLDNDEWNQESHSLSVDADNNPAFSFRFRANISSASDIIRLDDVKLSGEALPLPGTIQGFKYHDEDANGEYDEEESGLGGWEMAIYTNGYNFLATTTTDSDGNFEFADLTPGTYRVCETKTFPTGPHEPWWLQTEPAPAAEQECFDGWRGYDVTVSEDETISEGIIFGNAEGAVIGGWKYADDNKNGERDGGEAGVAGFTINLYQGGEPLASKQTLPDDGDQDGIYYFERLWPGEYLICEEQQNGWTQTGPTTTDETHLLCETEGTIGHLVTVGIGEWNYENHFHNFQLVAPEVPELISPEDESVATSTELMLDWSDVPPLPENPVIYDVELRYGTSTGPATAGWPGVALSELDLSNEGLTGGLWFWQVRACEDTTEYDNCSDWTEPWQFWLVVAGDVIGPRVEITSLADGQIINGEVAIAGIIADENPGHYWLSIKNVTGTPSYSGGPGTVPQLISYDTETHLFIWDTDGLDGEYWIKLEARDYFGNKEPNLAPVPEATAYPDANTTDSIHWIKVIVDEDYVPPSDETPPPLPIHLSPFDGAIRNTLGLILDFTDVLDDMSNPVTYYYQSAHDGATTTDNAFLTPIWNSEPLSISENDGIGSPEAKYWWHVRACDAVGNCSLWTDAWTLTVDNTAPTTTITSPNPDSTFEGSIFIEGYTNDNVGVGTTTLTFADATFDEGWTCGEYSEITVATGTPSTNFNWSYDWTPAEDGTYCIKGAGTDLAGNEEHSYIVVPVTYQKSVTPPPTPPEEENNGGGGGVSGGCYNCGGGSGIGGGATTEETFGEGGDNPILSLGTDRAVPPRNEAAGPIGDFADEEIDDDSVTTTGTSSVAVTGSPLLAATGSLLLDWWWLILLIILAGIAGWWYWRKYKQEGTTPPRQPEQPMF